MSDRGEIIQSNSLKQILNHFFQQFVDDFSPITGGPAFNKMLELFVPPPSSRVTQLERPQKAIRLSKIRPNRENLMNQILHALDSIFPQRSYDQSIIRQRNTRAFDFTVSTLVDKTVDGLEIGFAISDVGFNNMKHFLSGFGKFDEDAVVDLEKPEELQYFSGFRSSLVDPRIS